MTFTPVYPTVEGAPIYNGGVSSSGTVIIDKKAKPWKEATSLLKRRYNDDALPSLVQLQSGKSVVVTFGSGVTYSGKLENTSDSLNEVVDTESYTEVTITGDIMPVETFLGLLTKVFDAGENWAKVELIKRKLQLGDVPLEEVSNIESLLATAFTALATNMVTFSSASLSGSGMPVSQQAISGSICPYVETHSMEFTLKLLL